MLLFLLWEKVLSMKTVHCRAGELYTTAIKYEERLKGASSVELLECFIESKTKQNKNLQASWMCWNFESKMQQVHVEKFWSMMSVRPVGTWPGQSVPFVEKEEAWLWEKIGADADLAAVLSELDILSLNEEQSYRNELGASPGWLIINVKNHWTSHPPGILEKASTFQTFWGFLPHIHDIFFLAATFSLLIIPTIDTRTQVCPFLNFLLSLKEKKNTPDC